MWIETQNSNNYNLKQSQIIHYVFLRSRFSGNEKTVSIFPFFYQLYFLLAQDNTLKIERAYPEYKEGFYEGDTAKLVQSIKPSLYKYGYWKNKISGMYAPDGQMTFIRAIQDAKRVYIKKNFAKQAVIKK